MRDFRGVDPKTGMTDRGPDGSLPPQRLSSKSRKKMKGRGRKHSLASARDEAGRSVFRAMHGKKAAKKKKRVLGDGGRGRLPESMSDLETYASGMGG